MKYYLDLEFYEYPSRIGGAIDLISVGIVAQDGRSYYAVNSEFSWSSLKQHASMGGYASETPRWLLDNVLPNLRTVNRKNKLHIRDDLLRFIHDKPEFWGYYCDYDWVCFCWIFGRMVDLPAEWPKYCLDLKQEIKRLKVTREELPKQVGTEHNALDDALWNKWVGEYLEKVPAS